jgi:GT2 family glycosyltransferase
MYLSGANAFVDREKILQLKGFDEIFSPFYIEDFELSLRAWRVGWKCYYDHSSVCRHRTSATIKTNNKKKYIQIIYNRNKMYLHAIHLNGLIKFFWYLQLTAELIFRVLTFDFYYLKSFYLFLIDEKKISTSRRAFSALMKNRHINFSVKGVVKIIRSSLADKPISRI